jgi:indolepyruvate ferredoxin oxidoreductase alpha subunit
LSILTIREKNKRVLATGNEAIARGALEAGIGFASTYPGTPASEIGDSFYEARKELEGLYFEYSTNEKVAFEGAIGAAWCGIRALCSMKLPGVNVIADPLHSICYFGVKGLVFVNAGDPGLQSSATEQDNRWYGVHAHFPVIEPSTVQEAKDFTKRAFEVSERFGLPCMINIANDLSHGSELIELGDLPQKFPTQGNFVGPLVKRAVRSVGLHKALLEKMEALADCYAKSDLNKVLTGRRPLGIVTSGLPYCYTMEALDMLGISDVHVLKLGLTYPISPKLIKQFSENIDQIIIVEELDPFLETQIKRISWDLGLKISIIGKEILPSWGALSTDMVTIALAKQLGVVLPTGFREAEERRKKQQSPVTLSERIPTLCVGCPHRGSAYAVKQTLKGKRVIGSDIGCYGMLRREPWELTDWSLCMGGGIGVAQGMSHKLDDVPLISFIGDSTFFHAGLEPVLNAVFYDSNVLLIILDNRWTSMTGHQPTPSTLEDVIGQPMKTIPIKNILKGLGVKQIWVADAYHPREMMRILKVAISKKGFRVLIAEGECILQIQRRRQLLNIPTKTYAVDSELCSKCGICHEFTCPAVKKRNGDSNAEYFIDSGLCARCGACVDICPRKAIIQVD